MIPATFEYDTIDVTVDEAVATITLNRPDQLNAWDWQMHRELRTAYAALDASDDVRAIVLTGPAGPSVPAPPSRRRVRRSTAPAIRLCGTSAIRGQRWMPPS